MATKKKKEAAKPKLLLTHPILGDRYSDKAHAKSIMARPNNGGWKWIDPPKTAADGNSTGVQGQDGKSSEQGGDSKGSETGGEG